LHFKPRTNDNRFQYARSILKTDVISVGTWAGFQRVFCTAGQGYSGARTRSPLELSHDRSDCQTGQIASAVPYAVGLYITSAYWFTASTSFANPAVTIARSLSDTFAGIAPGGVLAFIAAQLAGMMAAVGIAEWLWPKTVKSFC
jgi:glycerol uptake facilitator-like aquaporin